MGKIIEYSSENKFLEQLSKFDICENPYQSFAYYSVYFEFYKSQKYRFFDVFDNNNKLLGIVPLQCYKRLFGVELLRFIGYGQFNYEQYICRNEDTELVHEIFVNYIKTRKGRVIIDFFDINNTMPLYELLCKEVAIKTVIQLYGCPLVDFKEECFDDFFKNAFKEAKKRTELKKFQKKLEGIGDFKICNVKDKSTYMEYEKYLPDMYRVFAERFAGVYATSFFSSPSMRPYYEKLIKTLVEHRKGFISLMLLDDTLIAFIFCLSNHNTLIDWIPAFDPAFSKYNLGTVQYKMLFEEMCSDKSYEYFDFSKGSTVYKKKWSKNETYNYQFIVNYAPNNIIASMMYIIYKSFFQFKTMMRNYGINDKIKHLIGSFQKIFKRENSQNAIVSFEEIERSQNGNSFKYSDLKLFPVNVRMEILNRMYAGFVLEDVMTDGNTYTISMSKI